MRMTFSKIVTYCRLINEMEVIPSIMLPLMRMAIEISSSMLSFGKEFQKGCSITHTINGSYAAI